MNIMKKLLAGALGIALAASVTACGSSGAAETGGSSAAGAASADAATPAATQAAGSTDAQAAADSTVNIGATDTIGTVNPLNMDWTFINYYATSFEFLPLVGTAADYSQVPMISEPITTDDNLTFNIKIRDGAVWSDGEPITTDDIIWTILKMTSPSVANPNFDFTNIKGISDDNLSPEGADSLEGLVKVDDQNMQIVMKSEMGLNTFINNVGSWILILPEHALKDIPDDQLLTSDWFNAPTVVSGPYQIAGVDPSHYVTYKANENYFQGAPKIANLNLRIEDASALAAGLQSGEIDFTHPAFSNVAVEDRKTLAGLSNVTTSYSDPITNEMTFFNTKNVTDAKVRRAIVEAIDRELLVSQLLGGEGEVTDGFVCTKSPFYDSSKQNIPYDPDDAKKLLADAGWDSSKTLEWYVSSSDTAGVRAVQVAKEQLAAVGVNVNINTVDFSTLMDIAGQNSFDIFSVQYTITPSDYYADGASLVDAEESWTGGWMDDEMDGIFAKTQTTTDEAELTKLYLAMDQKLIDEVPVFSLYFMSNCGSVSNRLKNASPTLFGAFNNIQDWEIAE